MTGVVLRCSLPALALMVLGVPPLRAENWPQWRGLVGDGVSKETNLPSAWGPEKNVAWKLPMPGIAGSTPVIAAGRLYLTSEEGNDLVALCVTTEGKEVWKRKLAESNPARYMRGEANNASPSPCTDGKHLYCYFGNGDFVCVDVEGNPVWRFNAQERYGKFRIQHGMHVTPYLDGDRLYLVLLHSGGHWIIALDKATGQDVWKVKRPSDARFENEHSYASPFVWRKGENAYLVVHGNDYTTAHRLTDGGEVWRLAGLNPKETYHSTLRFVASPGISPDLIVVPTAKGGPVVGVNPEATGTITPGSSFEVWRRPRNTPDVPSPLIHDGLVYLCGEGGLLLCLDGKTGKELYQHRLHSQRYRASPVYADGKVYCTARDGTVSVVKAGPTFELLSVNKLPDTITASPVVSGGRIYMRVWQALYAIGTCK
jgi:outer membrane protein assembly factor BamB